MSDVRTGEIATGDAAAAAAAAEPWAPSPAGPRRLTGQRVAAEISRFAPLVLLVGLIILCSVESSAFLTKANIGNILSEQTPLALVAVAGTFVIICGGFDLSTTSMIVMAAVCSVWVSIRIDSTLLALLIAPFVGLGLGVLNGVLITTLRVHSFLATLATSLVYLGAAEIITNGLILSAPFGNTSFTLLGNGTVWGINYAVFVLVGFSLFAAIVLNRTALGRYVFAVGGNAEAAELSGVRTSFVRTSTFAISGLACGLAAAILVSLVGNVDTTQTALNFNLYAIAAVILGGTSIYGGYGAIWRSLCGVFVLALIDNYFNLLAISDFYLPVTKGALILAAVGLSTAGGRRR
jgi:ribose transport system permease protein